MKKIRIFLGILLGVLLIGGLAPVSQAGGERELRLFYLTDLEGRVREDEDQSIIGLAKLKTKLEELKKEDDNFLLLATGRSLASQDPRKGRDLAPLLDDLGLDVLAPGYGDLEYGYDNLLDFNRLGDFESISSNLSLEGGPGLAAYTIREVDGVRLGIFALMDRGPGAGREEAWDLEILDPIETGIKTVRDMKREGADLIICLGDLGSSQDKFFNSQRLMERVDGIDIMIDARGQKALTRQEGSRILVQEAGGLRGLGELKISMDSRAIRKLEAKSYGYDQMKRLKEDRRSLDLLEELDQARKVFLSEELGQLKVRLEAEDVRRRETAYGGYLADLALKYTSGDLALLAAGDIYGSLEAGPINRQGLYQTLTSKNRLRTVEIQAGDLKAVLEEALDSYPLESDFFPQLAGMELDFRPGGGSLDRIGAIRIEGRPLNMARSYKLTVSDSFLRDGRMAEILARTKPIARLDASLYDLVQEELKRQTVLDYKPGTRINFIGGQAENLDPTRLDLALNGRKIRGEAGLGRPFIDEGRTMIPLRLLAEALDQELDWDGTKKRIRLGDDIGLELGSKIVYKGSRRLEMDRAPFIKSSRTYVPLRFLSEVLGYKVFWDPAARTVNIMDQANY